MKKLNQTFYACPIYDECGVRPAVTDEICKKRISTGFCQDFIRGVRGNNNGQKSSKQKSS